MFFASPMMTALRMMADMPLRIHAATISKIERG
jgi:hypothetical protein